MSGKHVITDSLNAVWVKRAENNEKSPKNYIRCRKILVEPGTIIEITNNLNNNCQEEVQGRLSLKQVRTESLDTVQYLRVKQAENTESSPLNDAHHFKFLVEPGTIIRITNQLKRKCKE